METAGNRDTTQSRFKQFLQILTTDMQDDTTSSSTSTLPRNPQWLSLLQREKDTESNRRGASWPRPDKQGELEATSNRGKRSRSTSPSAATNVTRPSQQKEQQLGRFIISAVDPTANTKETTVITSKYDNNIKTTLTEGPQQLDQHNNPLQVGEGNTKGDPGTKDSRTPIDRQTQTHKAQVHADGKPTELSLIHI